MQSSPIYTPDDHADFGRVMNDMREIRRAARGSVVELEAYRGWRKTVVEIAARNPNLALGAADLACSLATPNSLLAHRTPAVVRALHKAFPDAESAAPMMRTLMLG